MPTPTQNNRAFAAALTKNQKRREKFRRIAQEISALESAGIESRNDPFYRSSLTPNPWRGLKSFDPELVGGPTVMQIDTRPGLCGKHE